MHLANTLVTTEMMVVAVMNAVVNAVVMGATYVAIMDAAVVGKATRMGMTVIAADAVDSFKWGLAGG